MVVADQQVTMRAGDKRTLEFTITDGASPAAAVNLSSLDLEFLVGPAKLSCATPNPNTAVVRKQSTVGNAEIEKTNAAGGICEVKLVNADTASLCGGYKWSLHTLDGSEPVRVAEGTLCIEPIIVPAS